MKIKISDLEKKVSYKIKRNAKSIGIDTAKITGITILTTDKDYLKMDNFVLSFKTANHKEVYETMVKTFERFFEEEQFAVIEEVFVGFSRAGSVELAKYGAFAISECIKKGMNYETISAISARSKFKINTKKYGKGKSKLAVRDWIESLGVKITDHNIADSFVLSMCGICENIDFKPKKKKATKRK